MNEEMCGGENERKAYETKSGGDGEHGVRVRRTGFLIHSPDCAISQTCVPGQVASTF